MTLRQIAVIPLLALVALVGALVGAPGQVLPVLQQLGIQSPPPVRAIVKGVVTRNGQPLAFAILHFQTSSGQVFHAVTHRDGTYSLGLPEGETTVVVLEQPPEGFAAVVEEARPIDSEESKQTIKPREATLSIQEGEQIVNLRLEK